MGHANKKRPISAIFCAGRPLWRASPGTFARQNLPFDRYRHRRHGNTLLTLIA